MSTATPSGATPSGNARWPSVLLILGAGVVSAFQVGKAPMALAAVQADLSIGLATASWLISALAIVGALAGAPIGLAVDHLGARRMAVGGLLLQAAGAALGGTGADIAVLLASRVVEGLGFIAVVVAAPALIVAVAPPRTRDRAMSVWATFMPVGMAIVLLAAPLLGVLGWQGFWLLNAALLAGYAGLMAAGLRALPPAEGPRRRIGPDLRRAVAAPGPWLLGGLFAAFAAAYFAVFGFLPSLLSDRLGVGNELGSILTAAAVSASAVGNLVCGALLGRGVAPLRIMLGGFAAMALGSAGILGGELPGLATYGLCIAFSFATGFIPVVILDRAPVYAPHPALVGVTIGFAMQGNNVGLLAGPAAAGAIAETAGWPAVSILVAAIAAAAALLIFRLRTLPARRTVAGGSEPQPLPSRS